MASNIYVYDPTVNDSLSKVRGVGRYLQILKENFPDWVFTNNLSTISNQQLAILINPFFNFLQPPLALRRVAKKQIAVIHDLIPLKYHKHFPVGIKRKINIFLNKLALKNYDLIVTDSQTSKQDITYILKGDKNKVKVIYPTLPKIFKPTSEKSRKDQPTSANIRYQKNSDKSDFSDLSGFPMSADESRSLPNSSGYCLYVGDATWNKNLVNLAKAIKIINVTCVFVGKVFEKSSSLPSEALAKDGWQKELKEFNNEIKDDKRFVLLGYVSDDKLMQLYQQARCNILVSRDEGFGFSYLEAASQGCPSVLSNIPVLHESSNNKGALFVKPDDPDEIANAMGEVYFNKGLRNKLGHLARERTKYFSQKRFASEFLKILNFKF